MSFMQYNGKTRTMYLLAVLRNTRTIEVEIVLLRTLEVKRNVGRGTPTNSSLVNIKIRIPLTVYG